jgi:hypothetical protein
MKQKVFFVMAIAIGSVLNAAADEVRTRNFVGYAYDRDTEELVYFERHSEAIRSDGGEILSTTYIAPSGEVIVERTVDFSTDELAPPFETEDVRTGYLEGMRYDDEAVVAYRRRPARSGIDERVFGDANSLVVDAGFDRFITSSWDRLAAGEAVGADFLVPSRLKRLPVEVEKIDEWRLDGEPVMTFKMSFRNPLVRLLAGSVKVTYHRDLKILMRYEGLSNIRDANGDNHEVRIDFPLSERSESLSDATRRAANDG